MGMRLYFAHPVSDYGTERQAASIASLRRCFGDAFILVNPDKPEHQEGYSMNGMGHFKDVVESCDSLAFLRFPNGSIGAGVGKEIGWAQDAGKAVFEITNGCVHPAPPIPATAVLTVEETREMLASCKLRLETA